VEDELYYAIRPMLATSQGTLVALSTPWGKRGWFYKEYSEGEGWQRVQVTAEQCPRIPTAFLEEERRVLPAAWYASEYLCTFADTVDQVFASEDIAACLLPAGSVTPWHVRSPAWQPDAISPAST